MPTPKKPRNTPKGRYLTTAQAAQILGVDQDTVRSYAARLGGRKVLGRWRWPAAAVHAEADGTPPSGRN